jgi:hypothetical protein
MPSSWFKRYHGFLLAGGLSMSVSICQFRRRWRRKTWVLLPAFLFAFGPMLLCRDSCFAGELEPMGYVFRLDGDWIQNDEPIKNAGDPVYAGATITLDPEYKVKNPMQGSIAIVLFNGNLETRSAESKENLYEPIKVPPVDRSTLLSRFLQAVAGLFAKRPENYAVTMARGGDSVRLQEAVVKLEDGKVDLTPVLKVVPPGKYLVRFRLVEREGTSGGSSAPKPVEFERKLHETPLIAVQGIRSGLWRMSLLRPQDERPLGVDAWVLVRTPERYQEAAESFKDALAITQSWGEKVDLSELRSFLRTSLDVLNQ